LLCAGASADEPSSAVFEARSQQNDAVIEPARRALSIIRSRSGLYAAEQRPLLTALIEAESQLGHLKEASRDLLWLERVNAATLSGDPIRHARELTRVGDWHCRLGDFFRGRARHRLAIKSARLLGSDAELVSAQLGLGRCALHEYSARGMRTAGAIFEEYRGAIRDPALAGSDQAGSSGGGGRGLRTEAERAVRDAARRAVSSQTLTAQAKADTLLFAGDWFQLKGFTRTARGYYAEAAKLRSTGDELDTPVRVLYAIPPLALRAYSAKPAVRRERFVVVEFTVRADGSVETPRVLERNVTKSMLDETLAALRSARYRPRVVNGEPVESRIVMRQSFDEARAMTTSLSYSNAE
jgi:TonB family protein